MTNISSSTVSLSGARSLFRKSATALVLVSALASMSVAGSSSAQAGPFGGGFHGGGFHGGGFHGGWGHHGGWGRGMGLGLGLGLLGAAAYGAYGSGPVCHWRSQYDAYGEYIGRVRVCPIVTD
jgi:hypothetical protein